MHQLEKKAKGEGGGQEGQDDDPHGRENLIKRSRTQNHNKLDKTDLFGTELSPS